MPKNYNMKEMILELLEGKELSKKELLEDIRKKSNRSTSDKTLNESLMILLKEKKDLYNQLRFRNLRWV